MKKNFVLVWVGVVVLMLLSTVVVMPIQSSKIASVKLDKVRCAKSKEKVKCSIVDERGRSIVAESMLDKDQIEKLKEVLKEVKESGFREEKIEELQSLLKDYKLLPENFDLKDLLKKPFRQYYSLTFGEFKREILSRYPLFSPLLKNAFAKIESVGIDDDMKVEEAMNILKTRHIQQLPGAIFNVLCFVSAFGLGYFLSIPPLIPIKILSIGLLAGLGIPAAKAWVFTLGLLGTQTVSAQGIITLLLGFVGLIFWAPSGAGANALGVSLVTLALVLH